MFPGDESSWRFAMLIRKGCNERKCLKGRVMTACYEYHDCLSVRLVLPPWFTGYLFQEVVSRR